MARLNDPKRAAVKPTIGARIYLLVSVQQFRFALPAEAIEEVRSRESVQRCEFSEPLLKKICGTVSRAGEAHFVVDPSIYFDIDASRLSHVVLFRSRAAALLVDEVDRMHSATQLALPEIFRGAERNWYSGLAQLDGRVVPVVDPENLISAVEFTLLRRALSQLAEGASA